MSDIQLFDNGEFHLEFVPAGDSFTLQASDLARALGYREAYDLVRCLPDDEKIPELVRTPNGVTTTVWCVTESGFYRVLGQRQPSRIKNLEMRSFVQRFQDWVYRDVLPTIRRTGRYEVVPDKPTTHTWDEVTTLMRQQYGIVVSVPVLTRTLRTAGVLRQTGVPKKKHQHFFWYTGTAWEIHPHAVPFITRMFEDTRRELADFRFLQARLELDGVGDQPPDRHRLTP